MEGQGPASVYSERFGDFYFSRHNGLEETRHVFLRGNDLPSLWQGKKNFVIAETGFGTGMNFLAAWELFDRSARQGQCLHYIGAELYPLGRETLARFLIPLFKDRARQLVESWPPPLPGYHRLTLAPDIVLTLVFDDVRKTLKEMRGPVDCWFLDGFMPSRNPDMWSEDVFNNMARLSRPGSRFATFTAAGFVRRGLIKAGFDVRKVKGYARKREMLTGVFSGTNAHSSPGLMATLQGDVRSSPGTIAIVGGGLAGSAAQYALKSRGIDTVLYEKEGELARGASGNPVGLFNPRPFSMRHPRCDYHTAGLSLIIRTARALADTADINFRLTGCLHLGGGRQQSQRNLNAVQGMSWPRDLLHYCETGEASHLAGVMLKNRALYSPLAGTLCPPALVQAYTRGSDVRTGCEVTFLARTKSGWALFGPSGECVGDAKVVILTRPIPVDTGWPEEAMENYDRLRHLLRPVRGQITRMRAGRRLSNLRCNLAYGGYITRYRDHELVLGATFQRGNSSAKPQATDDYYNYYQLKKALPDLTPSPCFTGRRASVRLTTPDHMPLAGEAGPGLYISSGWGSHGLLGTLLGGHVIADLICQTPLPVSAAVGDALDPKRFFLRNSKRPH